MAFIQAIDIGICLLVAGVPWAGVFAIVVLVLGIAQVPALLVTLPAIAYLWFSGDYGTRSSWVGWSRIRKLDSLRRPRTRGPAA